jgi:hypothetical protein
MRDFARSQSFLKALLSVHLIDSPLKCNDASCRTFLPPALQSIPALLLAFLLALALPLLHTHLHPLRLILTLPVLGRFHRAQTLTALAQ